MNNNTLPYGKKIASIAVAVCVSYTVYGAADEGLVQKKGTIQNQGRIVSKKNGIKVEDGKIINEDGKILVEGQITQTGGEIKNAKGQIVIDGQATILQDTLNGRVEYILNSDKFPQYIPQKVYEDVYFAGQSKKMLLDTAAKLTALKKFSSDSTAHFQLEKKVEINAHGKVEHNGKINPDRLHGQFRMNGENAQDIEGKGSFQEVELNNGAGADVRNGGGFKINTKLELTKGELRNSAENNFEMGDSALIVRNVEGAIAHEPVFKENVSVKYVGNGAIASGAELSTQTNVLKTLTVENTGGVNLSRSVTVKDSLRLAANISTGTDTSRVLTLSSRNNPEFINPDAEVVGSMRRTDLGSDSSKVVFNNQHTYAQFADASARGNVKELTYRMVPATYPTPNDGQRIKRTLDISATDLNGASVSNGFSMRVGFGWRDVPGNGIDETGTLSVPDVVLQRLSDGNWVNASEMNIAAYSVSGWGIGQANGVQSAGSFSFGSTAFIPLAINARVILEGAYRNGSMAMDLRDEKLIPTTPPSIYPYNLDPNRSFISVDSIPAGVIDWVVVELRSELTGGNSIYRTCFVAMDGRIVGLDGKSNVTLPELTSGDFYVAIRHRTHLAVMTSEPRSLKQNSVQSIVDFTTGQGVLGGSTALKPVGLNNNGSPVFGMTAGDVNGDGVIDNADYEAAWGERNNGDAYLNSDTDMNGVVNTKDANASWNNRGKETVVP
jgi:hypothetical protein